MYIENEKGSNHMGITVGTVVLDRYGNKGKILSVDDKNKVAWVKRDKGYSLEKINTLNVVRR